LAEVRTRMYNVYFAKSLKNKKIYCGYTIKDPKIRIKEHNEGNTQWSRNNRPLKLVYFESFVCKEDGAKREKFFKTGIGKKIKKAIVQVMDS
jgi:putative endonuclease